MLQHVAAQQAAAAKGPHAPKHAVPAPASCPRTAQPGVFSYRGGTFHESIVNEAVAISSQGTVYAVYAGARQADATQGLVIVVRMDKDPCAPGAAGAKATYFDTPFRQGALTLTQIVGNTVAFSSASGGTGHFDYVSGQFLAS